MGSGVIAPRILNLGTVVSFTPAALYTLKKHPRYPGGMRLDRLQSRSGRSDLLTYFMVQDIL
jgi:hypothetical protein